MRQNNLLTRKRTHTPLALKEGGELRGRRIFPLALACLLAFLSACAGPATTSPAFSPSTSADASSPELWKFYYTVSGDDLTVEARGSEHRENPEGDQDLYLIPWTGLLLRSGSPTLSDGVVLYFPQEMKAGAIYHFGIYLDGAGRPRPGAVTAFFRQDGVKYGVQSGNLEIESVGEDQHITGSFQFTAVSLDTFQQRILVKGWFRGIPLYPPPLPFAKTPSATAETP